MHSSNKIFIAGHRGMVGSAIHRLLDAQGYGNLVLRTRQELDLFDGDAVKQFLEKEKLDVIIIAAARVGGIHANNTYVAEFLHENLTIAHNLIHNAYVCDIPRVLFLGSSCIYPREAEQPMKEEVLLTGSLEPTNEAYAIAKIAGLKLCECYRRQYGVLFHSLMPCNMYGPRDNYHPENAHVFAALIKRFHEAKVKGDGETSLWGTGKPRREFLHVDDCAQAVLHFLKMDNPPDCANIGYGSDMTILELAEIVKEVVGYQGNITFDTSRPDGMPRKLLNTTRAKSLGWEPMIDLRDGVADTYRAFLEEEATVAAEFTHF